jgi:hypothetical protein
VNTYPLERANFTLSCALKALSEILTDIAVGNVPTSDAPTQENAPVDETGAQEVGDAGSPPS